MRSRQGPSVRSRAMGALLAILALATAPAVDGVRAVRGQYTIWSAEMVVGTDCDMPDDDCRWGVSWNGWANDYEQWGSISSDGFTYGHPIRVKGVWRNTHLDDVLLVLDAALPEHQGMTLSLGSVDLPLSTASHRNGCGATFKWSAASAVQWTKGDTIAVQLTSASPAPASPGMAVYFMDANYEASEGGAPAKVQMQLTGNPEHNVGVPFSYEWYGGVDWEDFVVMENGVRITSQWIQFAQGEKRKTLTVMAEDDDEDDDNEAIALSIGALDCGVMAGDPATAMVSLKDNDGVDGDNGNGNNENEDSENEDSENENNENSDTTNTGGGNNGGGNNGGGNNGGTNNGGTNNGGQGSGGGGGSGGGDGDDEDGGRDTPPPPPMVAFDTDFRTVLEGKEVSVTVRLLNTDFTEPVKIPILTADGQGITRDDYSGVPESVVFQPGKTSTSFRFIANQDELYEYDEWVVLNLGTLPTGLDGGSPSSTTIAIQDLFVEPTVNIANGVAYEHRTEITFTVRPTFPSAERVSVRWTTKDGEAVAGEDYESTSGIVSFAPGVTEPVVIRVPIVDDAYSEPNETFTLVMSDPQNVRAGPVATGAIIDDDQQGVEITPQDLVIQEGQTGSYTVVLESAPKEAVTVTMSMAGETALLLNPATLVFTADDWNEARTVTVGAPDDSDALVETPVAIGHGVSGGDYDDQSAPSVNVSIAETDFAQVSIGDARAGEGDGEIVFVAEMDMPTNRVVEVRWRTEGGSATEGTDYTGARGRLTFEPMQTRVEIPVQILDDKTDEPAESFDITLSRVTNAKLGDARATGVIADDDLASVSIEAAMPFVTEGEPARFVLSRVGDLTAPLSVPVEIEEVGHVLDGTPPEAATFAVGAAITMLSVPTRDDEMDEANAQIEVRILPGDDHEVLGESSAVVTVADNDLPSVSIVAAQDQVTEGDEARFNVTRIGDVSVALEVPVVVGQTGDVLSGAPPSSVAFETGADTAVLMVATHDDQLDEEDGTVEARLGDGGGHDVAGAGEATVTVADNDAAPKVTVLSAQALERAGEIVFSVALGAPSGRMVSVGWGTSDGSATAGDDYGSDAGTLMIAPGRMADTIRIEIMDDLLDEQSETFSVTLDGLVNILPGSVTATGTILDDDLPVAKAWLSRFGRSVATQVVDAVSARVFRDYGPGGGFVLGGMNRVDAGWADIVTGSSFRYSMVGQTAPGGAPRGWTVWGRGASTRFSGEETEMTLNGGVVSGFVGVDFRQGPLLAGLLLSHSRGDGDYNGDMTMFEGRPVSLGQGELGSSLTGVHPYLRVNLTDRIATWGLLGRGWGDMTISEGGHDTGIGMNLGAVGARGMLLSPRASGGFGLALRSDAFYTGVSSERSAGGLPAEDVSVNRVRLALEGSRDMVTGNGARVGLSVEAGVRRDGGDAETGTGMEMGGRVRYANPRQGLSVEAAMRGLIAHQANDYEEWGFAGSLLFDPGRAERGFSMRMRSEWGSVFGGVDQLWSQQSVHGLSRGRLRGGSEPEVNAELNYGLATRGEKTLLTPFANILLAEGRTPAYRLGWRVKVGPSFRLSLENTIGGDAYRGSFGRGLQLRGSFRREQ